MVCGGGGVAPVVVILLFWPLPLPSFLSCVLWCVFCCFAVWCVWGWAGFPVSPIIATPKGKDPGPVDSSVADRVIVKGLPHDVTESDLRDLCGELGTVSEVFHPTHTDTGKPKGFAFVYFTGGVDMRRVGRHVSHTVKGHPVVIERALPKLPGMGAAKAASLAEEATRLAAASASSLQRAVADQEKAAVEAKARL